MRTTPPSLAAPSQQKVLQGLYLRLMFRATKFGRKDSRLLGPVAALGMSSGFFVLIGLFALAFSDMPLASFASSLHALTFLMVGMNLALVSGNLLFNKDEGDVLLHRPVDPKAMLAAKVRVIAMVSMVLAISLNLCGFVIGVARADGTWLFLASHLVALTLQVVFSASFVVLAYNLCLRWFGREKLDNLMTSVQVVVAISMVLGGQIVPRMMQRVNLADIGTLPGWAYALPPLWFGGVDAVITGKATSPIWYALAGVGVVATVLTAWIGLNRLAASYEQGLVTMNEMSESSFRGDRRVQAGAWLLKVPFVSAWVRDPVERASFRLTLAYLSRSRGVKLRVYPMLGQFLVYPVVVFFGGRSGASAFVDPIMFAFCGAFVSMLPSSVLDLLRLSEDWRAADLFWYVPAKRPASLFHGTRKAVITVLCVPALVLIFVGGLLYLRERAAVLLLLVPGILTIPVFTLLPALIRPYAPFSTQPEVEGQRSSGCFYSAAFMVGSMGVAGIAAFAWSYGFFGWMLLGEAVLVVGSSLLLRSIIERRPLPPAP